MANRDKHLTILERGVEKWNWWRESHPDVQPYLSKADLIGADLRRANFQGAHFLGVNFTKADLREANFTEARLDGAIFSGAKLSWANLRRAILMRATLDDADLYQASLIDGDLRQAYLYRADLTSAILYGVNLREANLKFAKLNNALLHYSDLSKANFESAKLNGAHLQESILVGTNLTAADLTGSWVYGASVWNVILKGTIQKNLVITPSDEPTIQVDDLRVAQFLYLLLNNAEIRHVIDTITSKVVLILGRFTDERKAVLEALRTALRQRDYLPVLFDFEKPSSRNITETVSTLAHMARFVIADITDAKSIPQELSFIVPHLPSVPVQPLLLKSQQEYSMFEHFTNFPWVLPVELYESQDELLGSLEQRVILPAETWIEKRRGKQGQ